MSKNDLKHLLSVVDEITTQDVNDHVIFQPATGKELIQPRMPYPGARIKIEFTFLTMKGIVWIDVATGDNVTPENKMVRVIRHNNKPLVGEDFALNAYPLEFIFAEKF